MRKRLIVVGIATALALTVARLQADGPMFPPDIWGGSNCRGGACIPCSTCGWLDFGCWMSCTWITDCSGCGGG